MGLMKLFFLIFATFLYSTNAQYNDSLIRYKFFPMASAALGNNPAACVKNTFPDSEFIRQYVVQCDQEAGDTCSGFSAVSHTDQAIILAFRGSVGDEVNNIKNEIIFDKQVPFFGGNGNVAVYFYNATVLVWNAGMKDDFFTLKNKYPTYEVWVTGHSLGAAEASVCAAMISALGYATPDKIKLMTIGQPRVGDKAFADAHAQLVPFSYRVVHANDWVPALPPQIWEGYTHHKSEVWYDNNMAVGDPYIECDEEEGKTCSDSQWDDVGSDHDFYFNKSVGFCA